METLTVNFICRVVGCALVSVTGTARANQISLGRVSGFSTSASSKSLLFCSLSQSSIGLNGTLHVLQRALLGFFSYGPFGERDDAGSETTNDSTARKLLNLQLKKVI